VATARAWATRCDLGLYGLTAVTVAASMLLILDGADADVLGPIVGMGAAGSGAFVAWSGVRRFASLSDAYRGVVAELEDFEARAERGVDGSEWPKFVADVEELLEREHLQWRAARR
jgi:hypothetical protein